MSATPAPPPARRGQRADDRTTARSAEPAARGAREEDLDRPAGELLSSIPWEGIAPDPDTLDAATFLAWL